MARVKNSANDYISNSPKLLSPGVRWMLTLQSGFSKTRNEVLGTAHWAQMLCSKECIKRAKQHLWSPWKETLTLSGSCLWNASSAMGTKEESLQCWAFSPKPASPENEFLIMNLDNELDNDFPTWIGILGERVRHLWKTCSCLCLSTFWGKYPKRTMVHLLRSDRALLGESVGTDTC